jgi:hypothetical protein
MIKISKAISFIVLLSMLSSCDRGPTLVTSEKQALAAKGVACPALCGYRDENDSKMWFWICTKKEVSVLNHDGYLTVEYKKNGRTFSSPRVFYYRLPKGCKTETIVKIGSFEKECFSARANELKKIEGNNR